MGQYCVARCRLSASCVVVCNARGRSAAAGLGAWPVRRQTLHGGTVRRGRHLASASADRRRKQIEQENIKHYKLFQHWVNI